MSDYAKKLHAFRDKRQKLTLAYEKLIEKRKKEISELAEQCDLLELDDKTLLHHFTSLKKQANEYPPQNSNPACAD